jgi:hypothetical protein
VRQVCNAVLANMQTAARVHVVCQVADPYLLQSSCCLKRCLLRLWFQCCRYLDFLDATGEHVVAWCAHKGQRRLRLPFGTHSGCDGPSSAAVI